MHLSILNYVIGSTYFFEVVKTGMKIMRCFIFFYGFHDEAGMVGPDIGYNFCSAEFCTVSYLCSICLLLFSQSGVSGLLIRTS